MKNTDTRLVRDCLPEIERQLQESDLFYGHGTDNPGAEAQWLLSAVLRQSGLDTVTLDSPVSDKDFRRMQALMEQRITKRTPLAYLLEEAWFCGLCFHVNEHVLVPRSPIAELIEQGFEPILEYPPETILDLCCGSGCIGIAAALAFPDSQVILSDLSEEALAVAQVNIHRFELQERVQICHSDLFESISERFDLIISNPPYVPESEYRDLPLEYLQEPEMGLVSAGDGLAIPMRILEQAGSYLNQDGLLILETGYTWPSLAEALPEIPFLWLDFEYGGEGVCALSARQLQAHYGKGA